MPWPLARHHFHELEAKRIFLEGTFAFAAISMRLFSRDELLRYFA